MNPHVPLPDDDLPPASLSEPDETLRHQLEEAIARRFYESCDGVTQSLLTVCSWHITTQATALTLVINCPDLAVNWRVLNHLANLATPLEALAPNAHIRICPPEGAGEPLNIRIDEIPVFRDLL
jgi:hypothetical protein